MLWRLLVVPQGSLQHPALVESHPQRNLIGHNFLPTAVPLFTTPAGKPIQIERALSRVVLPEPPALYESEFMFIELFRHLQHKIQVKREEIQSSVHGQFE